MAAPRFSPSAPNDRPRTYASPDVVPAAWEADRPAEVVGLQPSGDRLGAPGPDQGFALKIARSMSDRIHLAAGEHLDDVIRGCLGVALRRASMFSRAPTVHDLTVAFTVWGFLDTDPPAELVSFRQPLFEGLRHVAHHYVESRVVVDAVPSSTLSMSHQAVTEAYPERWADLLGR